MVPRELGEFRHRARRYGIKVWFGPERPPREHYEAQAIAADNVEAATMLALEVGFHAEYPQGADNEEVIAHLLGCEDRWRPVIGGEAVAGSDPDLAIELAARLTDYVTALEALRRDR
jgi:hypothetical protein